MVLVCINLISHFIYGIITNRQLLAGEDDVEDNDYNTNSADGCKDSKDVDSCIKLVSKVRRNSNKSDHSSIMLIDVVKDPV